MVNKMQATLIKKELKGVVKDGNFFVNYLLVPLIIAVGVPVSLVLSIIFMEDGAQLEQIMAVIPNSAELAQESFTIISALFNGFLPMTFLMIPVMISAAMASSSFTGEKERRTLETLLYSPMSLRNIFDAKIIAAFLVSMLVTFVSFIAMVVIVGLLVWVFLGEFLVPSISWLVILGLVVPAFSFIGLIFQVKLSAESKNSQEAFQRSAVLILPLVMLIVTQSMGLLMVNMWMLLGVGFVLTGAAWLLMKTMFRKFTYEELLKG